MARLLTVTVLACLALGALAGTTTVTMESTTEASTTMETTTEAVTTTEETLPCSYDKDIGNSVGLTVFDAKFKTKKLDKPENDKDFGLNCGKKASTDTNDYSLMWTAPNNGLFSFDTDGSDADVYVQIMDGKNCKGKVIICDNNGVTFKAEKGKVYGIALFGVRGGAKGYFRLNIRKNCEYPYPSDSQCDAHCYAKSEVDIYKKCRVYYARVVENDNHCPRCRCYGVSVPDCTIVTKATKATKAMKTTKKEKKTTKKDKKTTKKDKKSSKKDSKKAKTTTKEERRRRRRRRN